MSHSVLIMRVAAPPVVALCMLVPTARAGVVEFTDASEWASAVGDFDTITFTEFPVGTFLADQYSDLGVHFTDGNDLIHQTATFSNDGRGVDGNGDITVAFDTPQAWIAVDYPGIIQIELYREGDLLYQSSVFFDDLVPGAFAGLISAALFDVVVLSEAGEAAIDDLHFGVPGPSGLAVFGVFVAFAGGRRRRGGAL